MKTEKQKMLAGELYNALDDALVRDREKVRMLLKDFNASVESEAEKRTRILKELIPAPVDSTAFLLRLRRKYFHRRWRIFQFQLRGS